jgi:serine/threonine protein kinase
VGERQFGPYRLVRQVAVGGMAEIHLAKTKGIAGFEKYVALKMIHPNFAQDEQFIQMLIDEAKIAVQLQHVNIAQTFDLGRVGDHYYITMEYVDGSDLYKILRRGSEQDRDVPLDVCAFVAKEIATGLDYAHRKKDMAGTPLGIVHRDVSPQNVLVSHAGEVKLVDFGIAKATMKVRQTAAGVIKGKYYYMSPEQAWGDKLDHRSDIFSAGIVLYEMMTGQMLYLEEDLHRLLDMVRKADIAPPTKLRHDVPPQLERIVMHALAKVAGERYQNAADMANDLEKFLHSYSPVFTAAKLAKHLRSVMGDPIALTTTPPPDDDPVISTVEVGDEDLLHDRAELRDENSVIFRLDGLKPQPDRANAGANAAARPATPRAPTPQPAPRVPAPLPRTPTPPVAAARPRPPTLGPKMELPRITQRQPGGKTQPPPIGAAAPAQQVIQVPALPALAPRAPEPVAAAPTRPARAPSKPRDPQEETRPVDARMLAASTWAMDDGDDDPDSVGERTMISAPPGFDGGTGTGTGTGTGSGPVTAPTERPSGFPLDGATEDIAFEPTTIEQGWNAGTPAPLPRTPTPPSDDTADEDEDGPTLAPSGDEDDGPTRAQHARPGDDDDDGPTLTHGAAVRGGVPGIPSIANPPIAAPRAPRAPNPALAASTPTPAVSELRRPQRSRRTPAGGTPVQGSVLQSMLAGVASEPMPTRPGGGRGGPSDGVPPDPTDAPSGAIHHPGSGPVHHQPPPPHGQPAMQSMQSTPPPYVQAPHQMPPQYQGHAPPHDPSQSYPGQHQLPVHSMPPHLQPYGGWPQQQHQTPHPGGGLPPGIAQQPYPFQPYPGMPTFTQQMRAVIELDEIPSQFKLQQSGPRWFVLVIAAVLAIAGAALATYFILRRNAEPQVTAVLLIDSVPGGGTVVVDGKQLPHPTPVPFSETAPGQRHSVKITVAGHRPYQEEIVVPASGGEYRISPILQALTGKILIDSIPSGAEILIKGEGRGYTPGNLTDLEITSTKEIELRHKDYGSRIIPLVWPENGEIKLNVDLKK